LENSISDTPDPDSLTVKEKLQHGDRLLIRIEESVGATVSTVQERESSAEVLPA
jgi:hypothetical protein